MDYLLLLATAASLALAFADGASSSTVPAPTVVAPSPSATFVGLAGDVEQFPGVPFAKPPNGPRRLKPPQPITEPLGTYNATENPPACPQFVFDDSNEDNVVTSAIGKFANLEMVQKGVDESEDCLYLNIHRPAGTTADSKLPVLYWIYGGGFELCWNSMWDPVPWVSASVELNEPIVFVTVNYRVGGFGFLPGAKIKEDGSGNLGLLDQRLGLQWVSDNIEAFGGDPEKVTIWGESAGSISVFYQYLLYDGNNTYNGKPLFRGGIMNSGSAIPTLPIDSPKPQRVYNAVVEAGGCSGASDTLECLRGLDYDAFLNATNAVPFILSYNSLALSYLPRPDSLTLTDSPDALGYAGKYIRAPFILGDQEDEGTLFALALTNITTQDELVEYLGDFYFENAPTDLLDELVSCYADNETDGSPFRTGPENNLSPQFKRTAAILGDLVFTLTRRAVLDIFHESTPDIPFWSYLSSYDYGTPVLGTFHGSDILQGYFGIAPNHASHAYKQYYLSFTNHLDPNKAAGPEFLHWPEWAGNRELLNMYTDRSGLVKDDFRSGAYQLIKSNIGHFYF